MRYYSTRLSFNTVTSTFGASTVGARFAATAAAKPGMRPDWFMPGGRPKNKSPTEPDIDAAADELSLLAGVGILTLLLPRVLLVFAVADVPVLSVDAVLDLLTLSAGADAKWLALIDGLVAVFADDVDTVAIDLRSATLFIPAGARPHLLETQPPTLPISPRLF